MIKFGFETYF